MPIILSKLFIHFKNYILLDLKQHKNTFIQAFIRYLVAEPACVNAASMKYLFVIVSFHNAFSMIWERIVVAS